MGEMKQNIIREIAMVTNSYMKNRGPLKSKK